MIPGSARRRLVCVFGSCVALLAFFSCLSSCGKFFPPLTSGGGGSSGGGGTRPATTCLPATWNESAEHRRVHHRQQRRERHSGAPWSVALEPTSLAVTPSDSYLYMAALPAAIYV